MKVRPSLARVGVAALLAGCDPAHPDPVEAHTPAAESHAGRFASSAGCRSCHPDAYASWSRSYHRTMTQRVGPGVVLADWDGVVLERDGRTYHLYEEDGHPWVDLPRPGTTGARDADRMQRPVVMTTGSHHLQLYWIPMPWLEDTPSEAGRATFQQRCATCHTVPGLEREGDADRSDLVNRSLPRPDLQTLLTHVPATGPHAAPMAALRPSEMADLLDFLERVQHSDRLAQFPFAWFIRQGRWLHEDDSFLAPPAEPDPIERLTEGWSDGCDRCHAVGAASAWDPSTQAGEAAVVDLGIACEACHGAGAAHARRYRDPVGRYAAHLGLAEADDIVVPSELPADRSAQVCGQCHAELVPRAGVDVPLDFRPGDDLGQLVHFVQRTEARPEWLVEHLEAEPDALESGFWNDGTMRIAGRDHTALLETTCHTQGELACTTCHSLHAADPNDQLKRSATGTDARGEAVCVDCHPAEASERHHHHPPESAGARCMSCHMPRTTIGLLTVMRAHRIDSPQPARAAETGRPDACSLCHLDQPLAWSAGWTTAWYGQPPLVGASPTPAAVDWLLRGDAAQRAVVAWHLGTPDTQTGTDWTPVFLAASIDDPYVAVRSIVHQRVRTLEGYTDLDWDPTADADHLASARATVLARWAERNPSLDRPDVWIEAGLPDLGRIERWRLLRDETPVSVNE